MKKMYAFLPIWILLFVPPILFVTLAYNVILTILTIGILYIFTSYNKEVFNIKSNLKIFLVYVLTNIITFALFIATELFNYNDSIKNGLIIPLEKNLYSKPVSFIYAVIAVLISVTIGTFLINKIIKKYNIDKAKKNILKVLLIVFLVPYLFLIPTTSVIKDKFSSLEEFKGISIKSSRIVKTFKYLQTSKYISSYTIDTHAEPYTINLYMKEMDSFIATIEYDAATLLHLIDDANEVNFIVDGRTYNFTINKINEIYGNIKKTSLDTINKRYTDKKFSEYLYLGHVGDFDVFDTSDFCLDEEQIVFEFNEEAYYVTCADLDKIVLFGKGIEIPIKDALRTKYVSEIELINHGIVRMVEQQ